MSEPVVLLGDDLREPAKRKVRCPNCQLPMDVKHSGDIAVSVMGAPMIFWTFYCQKCQLPFCLEKTQARRLGYSID